MGFFVRTIPKETADKSGPLRASGIFALVVAVRKRSVRDHDAVVHGLRNPSRSRQVHEVSQRLNV